MNTTIEYILNKYDLKLSKKHNDMIFKSTRVFIDPGHGGSDPGVEANDLVEKELNLVQALHLGNILAAFNMDVNYSRVDNHTEKTLRQRADEADLFKADVCFSVHNNAGGGHGFEAIHTIFKGQSQGDEIADSIGYAIRNLSYQDVRRIFDRMGKNEKDYYGIIRMTKMPTIILEGGFLDSSDHELLDTFEEQIMFAEIYAIGYLNYLGIVEYSEEVNEDHEPTSDDIMAFDAKVLINKGQFKKIVLEGDN